MSAKVPKPEKPQYPLEMIRLIKKLAKEPPEATFTDGKSMLDWLNDTEG